MSQLTRLRNLLGDQSVTDSTLQFYLDNAKDIICELRNSTDVESQYLTVQIKIAIEMYNKVGAEGQTAHSENGIARTYEASDISPSLINQITPRCYTPFSLPKVVI